MCISSQVCRKPILFSCTMTARANIKQPTVNSGYSKLCGRMWTVNLTSTHQWNLWVQGGQLLKMSVPLSIFIHSCSPSLPVCFVTLLFHSHATLAAFWCLVLSCSKVDEVSLMDTWYLCHSCYSNSLPGSLSVVVHCCCLWCIYFMSEDHSAFEAVNQT